MPKAKPVSLHPLSFDEAITAIINIPHRPTNKQANTKKKKNA
jgi:hypothetical protein